MMLVLLGNREKFSQRQTFMKNESKDIYKDRCMFFKFQKPVNQTNK